jgi:uncharacterized membrane protein YtjA (UPF0391 family)
MKPPLIFLPIALAAAIFGFSGVPAADIGVILFVVFGVLFLISLVFGGGYRTMPGFLGGVGGVALLAAAMLGAILFSGRFSLETAVAQLDRTLADARDGLGDVVDDPPDATGDEVENGLEDVSDAFDPSPKARPQGAE